jgi:nitrate reductase gamma subunit
MITVRARDPALIYEQSRQRSGGRPPRWTAVAISRLRVSPRPLLAAAVIGVGALVPAFVGLVRDGQVIAGAPAWLKPAKFAISIAIYCATLSWLLTLVRGHRRVVQTVGWLTGVALIAELALIDLQVLRGTTSHFNTSTPTDALILATMGALVALVFLAALATAGLLIRQRGLPHPLATGVRAGLVVSILGMTEAVLMVVNSTYHRGSGHTVGAPDGGPGLPLTGWSTQHGDLRVAHFVGLHALQVLPVLAVLLHRYGGAFPQPIQIRMMRTAAVGYAGLVGLLTWQAERGLPLLHPDMAVTAVGTAGATLTIGTAYLLLRRTTTPAATRSP